MTAKNAFWENDRILRNTAHLILTDFNGILSNTTTYLVCLKGYDCIFP